MGQVSSKKEKELELGDAKDLAGKARDGFEELLKTIREDIVGLKKVSKESQEKMVSEIDHTKSRMAELEKNLPKQYLYRLKQADTDHSEYEGAGIERIVQLHHQDYQLFESEMMNCIRPLKPIMEWLGCHDKKLKRKYRLLLGFGVAGLVTVASVATVIAVCHFHPGVAFQLPVEIGIVLVIAAVMILILCMALITGAIKIKDIRRKFGQGWKYIEASLQGLGDFVDSWLSGEDKDMLQLLKYLDERLNLKTAADEIFYSPELVTNEIRLRSQQIEEINK